MQSLDKALDEILEQLQTAHNYSDNKEPYLTNQRNEAHKAILSHVKELVDTIIGEDETPNPEWELSRVEYGHNGLRAEQRKKAKELL